MARIEFYFDYISSNAYLAWLALAEIAPRHRADIVPIPVLFAGLLDAHGTVGPAETPAKARWMWRNNQRKATNLGVLLRLPKYHPFNPLLALRASSLLGLGESRSAFISELFRAVWVEQEHVSEEHVVRLTADRVGLDGKDVVRRAQSLETKHNLRTQTQKAVDVGVFGVPTMIVEGELFWGHDDLEHLDRFLAGKDPLPEEVEDAQAPRASAVRRRFRP